MREIKGTTCSAPIFPKVVGSSTANTLIYQIEYNAATDSLVAAGQTTDDTLRGYTFSGNPTGLLVLYQGSSKAINWAITTQRSDYYASVTFSQDATALLTYSSSNWLTLFKVADGSYIGAKQLGNSQGFNSMARTMLMGSASSGTYRALLMTAYYSGVSHKGFQVVGMSI